MSALNHTLYQFPLYSTLLSIDKNDPLRVIEKDLHILSHSIYDGLDQIKKQQVRRLLKDLGVKSMTPSDLVTNHVIPLFKEDLWKVISLIDFFFHNYLYIVEFASFDYCKCIIFRVHHFFH